MTQTLTEPAGPPAAVPRAAPGPLGRPARPAHRRRGRTVLLWLAGIVLAASLSAAFAGTFKADYSAPGSDSRKAQDMLAQRFPAQSGDTVSVVISTDGPVTATNTRSEVAGLLKQLD